MDNVNTSKKSSSVIHIYILLHYGSMADLPALAAQISNTHTTPNRSLTELDRSDKDEMDGAEEDFHSTPLTVLEHPRGWGPNGMLSITIDNM